MGAEISEAERQKRLWNLNEKRRSFESSYQVKVLEAGLSIYKEAGVPKLLEELAEIIRPDFPDVQINNGSLMYGGTVSSRIEWDFEYESGKRPDNYRYSSVNIIAYPLTQDLAVMGGEELGVLNKSQWSSDPKLLEDAVVRAYQNPIKIMGPPVRLY